MASTVGIREAKINLSRILRRVRHGAEIVITDRGKPVGRIVPVRESAVDLDALVLDAQPGGGALVRGRRSARGVDHGLG